MNLLDISIQNILSPPILFFILGIFASRVHSDLEIPSAVGKVLSYYLLMVIGFKGGYELNMKAMDLTLLYSLTIAMAVAFLIPLVAYPLLRLTTGLDRINAAAIAAHYGSVSVVTFIAAVSLLAIYDVPYEGYLIAMMAIMEAPAIISGLAIAKSGGRGNGLKETIFSRKFLHEVMFGGTMLLLLGSFAVGWITGGRGMDSMSGFIKAPFIGILCFFLLEMGILAGKRLEDIRKAGFPLMVFGVYMPLIGAVIGIASGMLVGLSPGGTTLLAVLCASGSYIVVPAALRHALPEANLSLSMPLVLGVTFPFNIFVGIPVYYYVTKVLYDFFNL